MEIQSVSAGPFNPALWENDQLHWVPDVRMPLLAPRMGGAFRNIYAPSAAEEVSGWRSFYSAWDGTDSGCDKVYSATTPDFIHFDDRHTVISNGEVIHVSNVNVQKMPDGSLHLLATAWPDANKMKKLVYFFSPERKTWNGSPEPFGGRQKDMVRMEGYEGYESSWEYDTLTSYGGLVAQNHIGEHRVLIDGVAQSYRLPRTSPTPHTCQKILSGPEQSLPKKTWRNDPESYAQVQ